MTYPEDERADPVTGEILTDDAPVSGTLRRIDDDGYAAPKQASDAAGIIAMLEGGDFNHEVGEEIRELVKAMEVHAHNNKNTAKGSITIKLDVTLANGIFVLVGSHAIKKPVPKRIGTPLFARESGALGINPAGQYRSIGHQRDMREVVVEQNEREVREDRQARDI